MTHRTKVRPYVVTASSGIAVAQNPSASIELLDTNCGFIPNRMTTNQRNAIEQPEESMLIYNMDVSSYQYYNDGSWIMLNSSDVTIPDDLQVQSLTAANEIISPYIGTAGVACEGTINTATLVASNVAIGNDISLSEGHCIDFVMGDGGPDSNWRIGYGLNAFATNLVGANNNIGIVIGSGSSGPDGFAVGQTQGQSIFELDGNTRAAYFSGKVGIGVIGAGFGLAVSGGISSDSYTVGDWSLTTTNWPGQGGILFTGDETVNFGISSNGSNVQANLWIDGIINQNESNTGGLNNYFAERVGIKKETTTFDLDVGGTINSASGYYLGEDVIIGASGDITAHSYFLDNGLHVIDNAGNATVRSLTILSLNEVVIDSDLNANFVSLVVGNDVGSIQGDGTINTGHYYTFGDPFPGQQGTPIKALAATGLIFFDPDEMQFTANTPSAGGNSLYVSFTIPDGPNVSLQGGIYSDHVQVILGTDVNGDLDDTANTYSSIAELFTSAPISFFLSGDTTHSLHPDVNFVVTLSGGVDGTTGYDGKLMWDTSALYISVGASTSSTNNWYTAPLTPFT